MLPSAVILLVPLLAVDAPAVLWRDPGSVEQVDFIAAARGAATKPTEPFRFIGKPQGGTSLKIEVSDAEGREWRVKSGPEARAESFATRLVSALGYFAEITWFLASGKVEGAPASRPRHSLLDADGRFSYVSFELKEVNTNFLAESWTWTRSPFAGTRELKGLKLLMILMSNWDNKDARDERRGSNVSVIERNEANQRTRQYFVNDWGQSLGAWKTRFGGNGTCWDCSAFTRETSRFILGVENGMLRFGYRGQHTSDFSADITVADVRWLMRYLDRITDAQLRAGLMVSGATKDEEECFAKALRDRIERLRRAAGEE